MPAISSTATGKTILFGEHAVVHGSPAIAVPIHAIQVKAIIQPSISSQESMIWIRNNNGKESFKLTDLAEDNLFRGTITEFQHELQFSLPPFILTVTSEIPIAAGLGSSAAVAVAVIRVLGEFVGRKLSNEMVNRIAYRSEVIQHGSPSGIDNSVIAYEKPVYFEKDKPLEILQIKKKIHVVLGDSGERTLTKDVIQFVQESMQRDMDRFQDVFQRIGNVARSARTALENGDIQLIGSLMTENHRYLQELGVSSPKLDQLVSSAMQSDAYGAKLCGAGQGGFMVAACSREQQAAIANHLRNISPRVIEASIGGI